MKLWVKNNKTYHQFSNYDDANAFLEANPSSVIIESLPKGVSVKTHAPSVRGQIIITGGSDEALVREHSFEVDVFNCINEGENTQKFYERIVEAGLDLKKAKQAFSSLKSRGIIEVTK